jgi:hypothetical protein
MSGSKFEAFLARIYVDAATRERFLADPRGEATRAGLQSNEVEELVNIDRDGLELFAQSLTHKKAQRSHEHSKNRHR